MKNLLFVIFLIMLFEGNCQGVVCDLWHPLYLTDEFTCNDDSYILVFEDDFDNSIINEMDWLNGTYGWSNALIQNNEQQVYRSDNQYIENSKLKLFAVEETIWAKVFDYYPENYILEDGGQNYRQFNYTSGAIRSKKQFGYGKYEIYCRIPKGKGFWPAFWTYNGGLGPYGNAYCEIDIFEFWNENNFWGNYDPSLLAKVSNTNTHHNFLQVSNPNQNFSCSGKHNLGEDYSIGLHKFTMIYSPLKIEYFINDILVKEVYLLYKNGAIPYAVECFNYDLYNQGTGYNLNMAYPKFPYAFILANLAIQSGGNAPDATNNLTEKFEIDYIKYYKQVPCVGDIVANNTESLALSYDIYNYVAGKKVTLQNNIIIDEQLSGGILKEGQLKVAAKTEINLKPGFEVKNGSGFIGIIDNNLNTCYGKNRSNDSLELQKSLNIMTNDKAAVNLSDIDLLNFTENNFNFDSYPNPTKNLVHINIIENYSTNPIINNYTAFLLDIDGRQLLEIKLNSLQDTFSLESFQAGSYILRICDIDNDKCINKIIIKE